MPILSSCCCYFDLKVGTKIIGVLSLIGSLINSLTLAGTVVMFVFLGLGVDTVNKLSKELSKPPPAADYEYDDYVDVREEKGVPILEVIMDHIKAVTIVLYVMLALCLLMVITSSMLIHGVKNNKRGLLVPFIIQEVLNILIFFCLVIWGFVIFGSYSTAVYTLLGIMVGMGLHIYFALVVFSQYQALGLIRMHEEISMK